jgi:bacterial/archaeal transporter family protein
MEWFFWALASAFFAGVTALLAKIGVSGINSNLATAIRTSVILIFSWAIVFLTSGDVDLQSIGRKTWIFLVLSGVATGLSWLCYFRALQIGELSKVAPVDKLSVVVAMAFGAFFLHEKITAREGIGGFCIAAGALILAWKPSSAPTRPAPYQHFIAEATKYYAELGKWCSRMLSRIG